MGLSELGLDLLHSVGSNTILAHLRRSFPTLQALASVVQAYEVGRLIGNETGASALHSVRPINKLAAREKEPPMTPPPLGEGHGGRRTRRESRALLEGIISETPRRAS